MNDQALVILGLVALAAGIAYLIGRQQTGPTAAASARPIADQILERVRTTQHARAVKKVEDATGALIDNLAGSDTLPGGNAPAAATRAAAAPAPPAVQTSAPAAP